MPGAARGDGGRVMAALRQADIRRLCLRLPGASENIQWGEDRVFKVGGKMFCCSGIEDDSCYSFKVDEERFLELTDQPGIRPAPYLARAKWVQIEPARCELPAAELRALIERSFELVAAKIGRASWRERG